MGHSATLLLFAVGGALLALWLDVRFPDLPPSRMTVRLVHVGAAFAVVDVVAPGAVQLIVGAGDSSARVAAALVGALLPALVYAFLSGIWMLRLLTGTRARS